MELLNVIEQIPKPVLWIVIAFLVIVTIAVIYQYAKMKGLYGLRKNVYELFLEAEHMFWESGQGTQKLEWVVQQTRGLRPVWLQMVITEKRLTKIIKVWFKYVKDLLDDGKVNGSQKSE